MGDTYPNQILDPIVRAYVYRWPHEPTDDQEEFTVGSHLETPLFGLVSWPRQSTLSTLCDLLCPDIDCFLLDGDMHCYESQLMKLYRVPPI